MPTRDQQLASASTENVLRSLLRAHHAFPTSARFGLRWWQVDVGAAVIRALARLAWNVKTPTARTILEAKGRPTP